MLGSYKKDESFGIRLFYNSLMKILWSNNSSRFPINRSPLLTIVAWKSARNAKFWLAITTLIAIGLAVVLKFYLVPLVQRG
jgi:hypothetical protein